MSDYLYHMREIFHRMEIAGKAVSEDEVIDILLGSVEQHKVYEQVSLRLHVGMKWDRN